MDPILEEILEDDGELYDGGGLNELAPGIELGLIEEEDEETEIL